MTTGTVKFYNDMKGFDSYSRMTEARTFSFTPLRLSAPACGVSPKVRRSLDTAEDRRSGKVAVNNIQTA